MRYKYLGRKVVDVKPKGLNYSTEFYGIARSIIRDYKAHRINKKTAMGRLLLLYRLTYKKNNSNLRISTATASKIRRYIKTVMREL